MCVCVCVYIYIYIYIYIFLRRVDNAMFDINEDNKGQLKSSYADKILSWNAIRKCFYNTNMKDKYQYNILSYLIEIINYDSKLIPPNKPTPQSKPKST